MMLAVSFEAVVQPTARSTRSASGFLCVVFVSDKKSPDFSGIFVELNLRGIILICFC